jgi:8-oxo-dGTP pyrophosphatase MutT (NUDIX family)
MVTRDKTVRPKVKGVQYAALPYRVTPEGDIEVLLVTSLETKRWIIPKGWPMKGRSPGATAAREAYEEAGVEGDVDQTSFGEFVYDKRLKDGSILPCRVEVFAMHVAKQRPRFPEKGRRKVRWFGLEEAANVTGEPGLLPLFGRLREVGT